MAITQKMINRLVTATLNQNQFDGLISFTFNLGCGTLAKSTLLINLNSGNYASVPVEMLRFCLCAGKPDEGLLRRRKAEAQLFAS